MRNRNWIELERPRARAPRFPGRWLAAILALAAVTVPAGRAGAQARVDNPYVGARVYVNPQWAANARSVPGGERVANQPTAVWLDRIAAINGVNGSMGLQAHLDEAVRQAAGQPLVIQIVIYNLPGRDCAALASNGELGPTEIARYRTDYIDRIAAIMALPAYAGLRIVTIIEIDSLPNLITNVSGRPTVTPQCDVMKANGNYVTGIGYALARLGAIPNIYNYLDAAHHGWIGWADNFGATAEIMAQAANASGSTTANVWGFITNTANYSALSEPFFAIGDVIGGQRIRDTTRWIDFNDYTDELSFAQAFRQRLVQAGFPSSIGMLIDTSRNGWGGAARPTGPGPTTSPNAYVDGGRLDRRIHLGNWCNQSGAGLGERPRAAPAAGIDAYVWVKPPGESDGSSTEIPNDEGKGFDRMCDPTYGGNARNNNNMSGALANAPLSGHWFAAQFTQLMQNAFPPLGSTGPDTQAPTTPANLTSPSHTANSISLSWSASTDNVGVTGYRILEGTTQVGTSTTTTFTVTGLAASSTHTYRVTAVDAAGNVSGQSNAVTVTTNATGGDTQAPTAPTNLTSPSHTASSISLSWTASTDNVGVTGYRILEGTTQVGTSTTTTFTVTGLAASSTHTYRVTAVDAAGNVSAQSNAVTVTTDPSGPAPGGLRVQYRVSNTSVGDNQLGAHFQIVNGGTTTVTLSQVTMRYWFTVDGARPQTLWCDYTPRGCSNVSGAFVTVNPARTNADTYVEIRFAAGMGTLTAGQSTGEIQTRVSKDNWSNYNEANDYSFDSTKTAFADWNRVTMYVNGTLVWGTEPGGSALLSDELGAEDEEMSEDGGGCQAAPGQGGGPLGGLLVGFLALIGWSGRRRFARVLPFFAALLLLGCMDTDEAPDTSDEVQTLAASGGGVTVDVVTTNVWDGGFNGAMRITNNAFPAPITSFEVVFRLGGGATIPGQAWNGNISAADGSGNRTASNPSWLVHSPLAVGQSWDVGFTASGAFAGATFSALRVNGQNIPIGGAGDTTPPTVSLIASASNVTAAGPLTLTANASDNVGVSQVEFRDGASVIGVDSSAPYSLVVNLTAANNGTHSYTARASDAAGNTATSSAVQVNVNIAGGGDTTAPTVSLSASSSNVTTAGPLTLSASASDNVGVTQVEFRDGSSVIGSDTSAPYSFVVNLTSANNGSHSYTARARDAAGNVGTSSTVPVNVNISGGTGRPVFSTSGGRLFRNGAELRLFGLNWFGLETPDRVLHGLWTGRPLAQFLADMKSKGFNALRLPVSPQTINAGFPIGMAGPVTGEDGAALAGRDGRTALEYTLARAQAAGMFVLVDFHTCDPARLGGSLPGSPINCSGYTQANWIDDMRDLATLSLTYTNMVGIDLTNEPHMLTWSAWQNLASQAGQAILAVNPDITIWVEGVGNASDSGGFAANWGQNLRQAGAIPGIPANRLVFSPHSYGPSVAVLPYFSDANYPNNIPGILDTLFGHLVASGFTVITGEFGGHYTTNSQRSLDDKLWQDRFVDYQLARGARSFFYWAVNPNSGDTGGVYGDDWITWNQSKLTLLQRLMN